MILLGERLPFETFTEKEKRTMRSNVAKLVIGLAITAVGMFGADSSVGTWKLNVAKSKTTSSNPLISQTNIREATADGGVKVTRTEQATKGAPTNSSFAYKYDGKENPATGAPFDIISVKRIDANTTSFDVRKTGGKYHVTGQNVVSKDGKTMTQTSKGTDADGKSVVATYIFDKQ